MSKEQSVAPKERVNITYKSATGDQQEDVELPFRTLVMGDFRGHADETPIEERKPIAVDKDNFNAVLREQNVTVDVQVPDRLSGKPGEDMAVSLKIKSMADFTPEGIVDQVPAMKELLELRTALTSLKGPMGNVPSFKRKLAGAIADPEARAKLLAELGLDKKDEG